MPLDQNHDDGLQGGFMSFGAHLDELRRRLIWAMVVPLLLAVAAFALSDWLIEFITRPLYEALAAEGQPRVVQVLSPSEMVMAKLQLSVWCGVVLAVPWILWHVWRFVAPGLYAHERRYAQFLVPLSTLLVVLGLTGFYFALPYLLAALMSFAQVTPRLVPAAEEPVAALPSIPVLDADPSAARPGDLWMLRGDGQIYVAAGTARDDGKLEVRTIATSVATVGSFGSPSGGTVAQLYRLSEYIDFVLLFGVSIAIAFQMPVAVLLLGWLGVLDIPTLRKYRRHAFFACAIIAAVITPTVDAFSMLALLVPLYLLYELGIVLLHVAPARAVSEGGVMRNALGALVGRRKYRDRRTDGDEGEE
jgi:sec-independent protein translocase protein TatC